MSDSVEERPGGSSGLLRVMVLGGYGLIGSAVMRRLIAEGHEVIGVGRSADAVRRGPGDKWLVFDIGTQSVDGWRDAFTGVDVVVNASGALQDGARDDLTAIHQTALERMAEALGPTDIRFVQIAAVGVAMDASTEFFRSKARGEVALAPVNPVTLRPSLVISPDAYGGTALLRAAAAMPFVLPNALPDTRIHAVHIDDLSNAVLDAVEGRIAAGTTCDVTGANPTSLPALIRKTRIWLGFPAPLFELPVPGIALKTISSIADLAGRLGWRSPLRSTAVQVLSDGINGDPDALPMAGGRDCRPMDEIFATLPATAQDRWFSRLWLCFPLAILTLSLFWIASGLIGFLRFDTATAVLTSRGMSEGLASLIVAGGGVIDIVLGALILWRPWARAACLGMIGVSLGYLLGASIFAPDLWIDPLGPMMKVLPATLLPVFVLAMLDKR